MIERLSDERIDRWIESLSDITKKLGSNDKPVRKIIKKSLMVARGYYDAKIDAQAKTIEELWEVWSDCPISENAVQFLAKKLPKMDQHEAFIFSCAVGFFLAAGGTIKDGE